MVQNIINIGRVLTYISRTIRINTWTVLATLVVLIGCNMQNHQPDANEDMANYLRKLSATAKQSDEFPYFNSISVTSLEKEFESMPWVMKERKYLDYLLFLLMQGDNAKCIEKTEQYLIMKDSDITVNRSNLFYIKILAMAYLRKAEIDNCVLNHSGESCIFPIKGEGIHSKIEDTEKAAKIFLQLCQFNSNDWQSRWYYNLAHMAKDTYPDKVDARYLIPDSVFQSDVQIPKFNNIGMETATAINNHAGSANIEDFNNDGWLDIFTTGYSLDDPTKYLQNNSTGVFEDLSVQMGINGYSAGLNAIHGDVNNDGWTDVYIMRGAWLRHNGKMPNSLLINREGKQFVDETKKAGIFTLHPTGTVAFSDINLDGYLDIFVGNEYDRQNRHSSEMFINNGDGTFTDYANILGLQVNAYVKGAVWGDINNDRLPDLFISVFGGANKLYVNRGGADMNDWRFEEISERAGVAGPKMSFPAWIWDYDNDGLDDIMVFGYDNAQSHLIPEKTLKGYLGSEVSTIYPSLYKNLGEEKFRNVTKEVGLERTVFPMGANFGDIDNDGYLDFYLGTGEFNIWAQVPNRMFRNHAGQNFQDVTTAGGFGQIQKGHGVAFGDLDNDGDQDIYHQVGGASEGDVFHNMLYENPGFGNDWLNLKLEGKSANRSAIGTKIAVYLKTREGNNQVIYNSINTGGSFGANTLRAEIGLGKCGAVDSLVIKWPDKSQSIQIVKGIRKNNFFIIKQGESPVEVTLLSKSFSEKLNNHLHH